MVSAWLKSGYFRRDPEIVAFQSFYNSFSIT